ncbi:MULTISPECIES: FISUMP domain-containing protein [unclassified Carboxylicivirga]|uniref:FISUMP domain-containing protein n=1 Tax=Carboxylicivirga TaxID=1628153 RepID=UPI003D34F57B
MLVFISCEEEKTEVIDTTPPTEVLNLVATPGQGKVALQWDLPEKSDAAQIRITFVPVNDVSQPILLTPEFTSYEIVGLDDETEYTFTLQTVDIYVNKSVGTTVTALTEAPVIVEPDVLIDERDGRTYKITTIGDQVWMAENLAYLPAGHSFSGNTTGSESQPFTSHYYVYDFDEGGDMTVLNANTNAKTNYEQLGVLYNWYAAIGIPENVADASSLDAYMQTYTVCQGVCPDGWHLPSNEEYDELLVAIGKDVNTGGDPLKARSGWDVNQGTDEYGYGLLPTGRRKSDSALDFEGSPSYGYLWTSTFSKYETGTTETGTARAYNRYFKGADDYFKHNTYRSSYGLAVRCVKDSEE